MASMSLPPPERGVFALFCFFYTVQKFAVHLSLQLFLYVCVYTVTFWFVGERKLFYGLCEESLFIHMEFRVGMLCDMRCNWWWGSSPGNISAV